MIYRKLGDSGIDVSAVALGTWGIGGWMWGGVEEAKAVGAIHTAIEEGITLIDTAPIYGFGRSEEIVGRAIAGHRHQVVMATKCGMVWDREEGKFFHHSNDQGFTAGPASKKIYLCLRPDSILAEIDRSLARLKTDYIDLYQTHWQDPTTPIDDTMDTLLKLKTAGKIRAIGVSNATMDQIKAYGPIDSDQERFSLLDRDLEEQGVLDFLQQRHLAMLAYSPLCLGLLTGAITPGTRFAEGDVRRSDPRFQPETIRRVNTALEQVVVPIASGHGASVAQTILAWTAARPGMTSVLCGARDAAHAKENAAAGQLALSGEEIDRIDQTLRPEVMA